jgi:hypothetical protein
VDGFWCGVRRGIVGSTACFGRNDDDVTATLAREHYRAGRERESIETLIRRISELFPELDAEEVERAVRGQYAEFDNSSVRDFIPVLVERRVRTQLRDTVAPRHRA